MNFGIAIPHFHQIASPEAVRTVAQRAEALGFDSIWVTDHIVMPHPHVQRFGTLFYEALAVLSYMAACTSRIRIGTSVMILPYRNPLFLAKNLATVDVLSGGRLIAGVAVGWMEEEFAALGVPFAGRGRRGDEYIRILKCLWTEAQPRFEGQFHKFEGILAEPKPIQKPHPPIWVGGTSDAAIRRAAELGDGWHPVRQTLEDLRVTVPKFREYARRAGRDPMRLDICARVPLRIYGRGEAEMQRAGLMGTPDEIAAAVGKYVEVGVTHFMCDTFYAWPQLVGQTLPDVLATLDRFASEVRPRLR